MHRRVVGGWEAKRKMEVAGAATARKVDMVVTSYGNGSQVSEDEDVTVENVVVRMVEDS